jgi:hypothetical protein
LQEIDLWLAYPHSSYCRSAFVWHAARAEVPAAIPAAIPAATTEQIQQTVDRAIGYIQTESAAWLKHAQMRRLPSRADAALGAERSRTAGVRDRQEILGDTTESLLGSKDKLLSSKIFPNPADPPDPRPQGRGLNMGLPVPGRRCAVVARR